MSGRTALWKLSNDDTLFNVLEFDDNTEVGTSLPWYFDDRLQPFFQNYNPDYGHTLSVISSMKNKKGIEKELGITEHPYYVLIGPDRRILTRSNKVEDIIEYVTTNLTDFIETDWEEFIVKAGDLFKVGQTFAAQRIVSDFLRHARWRNSYSQEVHKIIPRIVATMKGDEMYMYYVGEIKNKYYRGVLLEEDVLLFKEAFNSIHIKGDD